MKDTPYTLDMETPLFGPMSLTCDRIGPVSEEDCKTCIGTGSCTYGKELTEREIEYEQ